MIKYTVTEFTPVLLNSILVSSASLIQSTNTSPGYCPPYRSVCIESKLLDFCPMTMRRPGARAYENPCSGPLPQTFISSALPKVDPLYGLGMVAKSMTPAIVRVTVLVMHAQSIAIIAPREQRRAEHTWVKREHEWRQEEETSVDAADAWFVIHKFTAVLMFVTHRFAEHVKKLNVSPILSRGMRDRLSSHFPPKKIFCWAAGMPSKPCSVSFSCNMGLRGSTSIVM